MEEEHQDYSCLGTFIHTSGHITTGNYTGKLFNVRPVTYLNNNVKISGGTGTEGNPYTLILS